MSEIDRINNDLVVDDMVYRPSTIKSQDDLSTTNDGRRSSDVLLSTIEELEKVKKQLDIAKSYLNERADKDKYADWVLMRIEELNK